MRQVARNSDGSPVRAGEAGTPAAEFVADFAAWNALGTGQSSATRQALIDDLDVSYNDGRVIVDADSNDDNVVDDTDTASSDPIYLAHTDDDNDTATGPEDDDDNPDDVDPVRIYARAVNSDGDQQGHYSQSQSLRIPTCLGLPGEFERESAGYLQLIELLDARSPSAQYATQRSDLHFPVFRSRMLTGR